MTPDWQTILDLYLQGEGSRAEVEALRLRLHLGEEERAEIESALRLADRLESAARLVVVPLDAPQRLHDRLAEYIQQYDWPNPPWFDEVGSNQSAMRLGRLDESAGEEATNSTIEGKTTTTSPPASSEPLKQFQAIARVCADPSAQPPSPARTEHRLLARLREFQQSEAGAVDPAVARRLLGQVELQATEPQRLPDLKAAAMDEEETEGDSKTPQSE